MTLRNKVNEIIDVTNYNVNVSSDFVNNMINITNHNVATTISAFNYITLNDYLLYCIIICLFVLIIINSHEISQLKEKLKL